MKRTLNTRGRWLPIALLGLLACIVAARPSQELAADSTRPGWPKEFDARGNKIVVYEPQLETFRGSRMIRRAAVSVTRADASEPVFGAVWLDATVATDSERKTVTPTRIKVTDVRFPRLTAEEAARLREDIAGEIPSWNLSYSLDALLAELRQIEEQRTAADGLKAELPRILFRTHPAFLLALQGEPAWRRLPDSRFERLENTAAFVVRDPESDTCYLHVPPFWWTAADPLGAWQAADGVPAGVGDLWKREPKPDLPAEEPGQEAPRRPEVIPVTDAAELVWTDGQAQYAPIAGTDLLYIKNTDSDVFLDTQTQFCYVLFSGRWYRSPAGKAAWEFVASDQLPPDFARIPVGSEKWHVLACVAGTPQAQQATRDAEVPEIGAVKPGPAPDLDATYDGEPQFTDVPNIGVRYAINTPYSIFCTGGRYYWCLDGIWYDSDFAVGPWCVCVWVPRCIYLLPPSCPHYYVTYCTVFGATPYAVYVGYYPGYRGCYVWRGCVVYGTGWGYRPWCGTRWYSRPVTWGVGACYSSVSCGWTIRVGSGGTCAWGIRSTTVVRSARVQPSAGGYWGGSLARPAVLRQEARDRAPAPVVLNPRQTLYARQPERLVPTPERPAARTPAPHPERESARDRSGPSAPHDPLPVPPTRVPPSRERRDDPASPAPPDREPLPRHEPREGPKSPPPVERDVPRTPPPPLDRETPRTPPRRDPSSEEPRRLPPPSQERREAPRDPPPPSREAPRTPPPAPQERREAPRDPLPPPREHRDPLPPPREQRDPAPPPREHREVPRDPSPPPREQHKDSPSSSDRRR